MVDAATIKRLEEASPVNCGVAKARRQMALSEMKGTIGQAAREAADVQAVESYLAPLLEAMPLAKRPTAQYLFKHAAEARILIECPRCLTRRHELGCRWR